MTLKIQVIDNEYCPVVICDQCGERIVGTGNYEWQPDGDGTIYFTHKQCCKIFEVQHGGRIGWYTAEIMDLLVYLRVNLKAE